MMKKTAQGFILFTVLMLMMVLSLFGLHFLDMALLEIKQNDSMLRKLQLTELSEQALSLAEKQDVKPCLIQSILPQILRDNPLSWWQSQATCAGNFQLFKYYYVVESLGADPCAYIEINSQKLTANYFRITLMGTQDDAKMVLQSTIAQPILGSSLHCATESHAVFPGRQMWRDLNESFEGRNSDVNTDTQG